MKNKFLRGAFVTTFTLFVAGCANTSSQMSENTTQVSKGMEAFNAICLQTAPSFSKAEAVAKTYGMVEKMPLGTGTILYTKDTKMNAQIKPYVECAVGSDTVGKSDVVGNFIKMIAAKTGSKASPMPTKTPFMASFRDRTYIFHLDRQGGDTFVMIDRDGLKKSLNKK